MKVFRGVTPHLLVGLTALIAHTAGQITIEAEKLVDFYGCSAAGLSPDVIRAAWDSAMDIAWVSSGLLIGPGSLQQNSSQDQEVQINTMISRVQPPTFLLPHL